MLVGKVVDLVLALQKLLTVQVSIASDRLVEILLVLAFALYLFILLLQSLNLNIFDLQLFDSVVIL